MANKLVNVTQLEYDLSRIASAIRDRGIGWSNMVFPEDFVNAIQYSDFNSLNNSEPATEIIAPGTAVFKTVDEDILNGYISQIANAIRNKTGYSGSFTFPRGIIGAINAMQQVSNTKIISAGTYTNTTGEIYTSDSIYVSSSEELGYQEIIINGDLYYAGKLVFYAPEYDYLYLQVYDYYGNQLTNYLIGDVTIELSYDWVVSQEFYDMFMSYFTGQSIISFTINSNTYTCPSGTLWSNWSVPSDLGNIITSSQVNGVLYAQIMSGSGPYYYDYIKDANGNYETYYEEIQSTSYTLTTTAPDSSTPKITFYYQSDSYEVPQGTTWGVFVADMAIIPSLSIAYENGIAYIYDNYNGGYVGTYDSNTAVKASDVIIENQYYYHGFYPSSSATVTFYIDNEEFSCTEGMTWRQYNPTISGGYYAYEGPGNTLCFTSEVASKALVYGSNMSNQYYYEWVGMDDAIQSGSYYTTSAMPTLVTANTIYDFKAYEQLTEAPVIYNYDCSNSYEIYINDSEGNVITDYYSNYIRGDGGYTSVNSAVPVYGQVSYRNLPNITFGGYYPAGDLTGQDSNITCKIKFYSDTILPSTLVDWLNTNSL